MSGSESDSQRYSPQNDESYRNGHQSRSRSRSRSASTGRGSSSNSSGSSRSRSRSNSGSSRSPSPAARSYSGSPGVNGSPDRENHLQNGSVHSRSRSRSQTRSRSGSRASSRSRSPSGSRGRSRSGSRSRSRSRSGSKSRSVSRSRSVSGSRSRSVSRSKSRSVSRSRSRSGSRSDRRSNRSLSKPRSSRSGSPPQLEVNVSDHSDVDRRSERSGTPQSPANGEIPADEDLFGDAMDLSDEENEPPQVEDFAEKEEEMEEEPKEELPPEVRIEAEIPKIGTDLGREVHFVKLPNFLSVETRPFDPETYEDELDEEETLDEEGRARIKLRVENTMRWRTNFDKDGNAIRESNTKLVKWSDGSMSLHLGSEIFDIYRQPLLGDHNHLFIRQGTGLQGQAIFRTKLSFRPHSTDSFTHRKITLSMADRSHKNVGVKVLSTVTNDPEVKRNESLRRDEDRLKTSQRRESKQRKVKDRSSGLTRGFIEDDDESGPSLMAIKQEMKRKAKDARHIYSSDEEDSDIETRPSKRIERAKRGLEDSEDESESGSNKRHKASDSGESDGEGSPGSRRSRSRSSGSGSNRSSRSRSSSGASRKSLSRSRSGSSGRSSPAGSRSPSGSESN